MAEFFVKQCTHRFFSLMLDYCLDQQPRFCKREFFCFSGNHHNILKICWSFFPLVTECFWGEGKFNGFQGRRRTFIRLLLTRVSSPKCCCSHNDANGYDKKPRKAGWHVGEKERENEACFLSSLKFALTKRRRNLFLQMTGIDFFWDCTRNNILIFPTSDDSISDFGLCCFTW